MLPLLIACGLTLALLGVFTQRFGVSWVDADSSARLASSGEDVTGDTELGFDVTLGAGTVTDQEQQVGLDVANLKGVLFVVTGNAGTTVVIETNDAGTPDHTLTFPAGGGELVWSSRFPSQVANPFGSTDVTTFFITKTGSDTPRVRARFLLNS